MNSQIEKSKQILYIKWKVTGNFYLKITNTDYISVIPRWGVLESWLSTPEQQQWLLLLKMFVYTWKQREFQSVFRIIREPNWCIIWAAFAMRCNLTAQIPWVFQHWRTTKTTRRRSCLFSAPCYLQTYF